MGQGSLQDWYRLGDEMTGAALWRALRVLVGEKLYMSRQCVLVPLSWVVWEKCVCSAWWVVFVQHDGGCDAPPLVHSWRPHLKCCIQFGCSNRRKTWTHWRRSRGGPQEWSKGRTPVLWSQAEREGHGSVQPGLEKALKRLNCNSLILKGDLQEKWRKYF